MMGNLIKAEFRKVLSLKAWWILLIPLAVVVFGMSLAWGSITNDFVEFLDDEDLIMNLTRIGLDPYALPVGLLSIAHGVNIAQLIPLVFGVFALAGEYRSKTITTTFLTAPNRLSALSAKMITYVAWGALYGVISYLVASLAALMSVDSPLMPSAGQWFGAFAATILAYILVTLLGIGVGAVLNNVVLAILVLIGYFLVVENVVVAMFWSSLDAIAGILPNGTANGIVGGIAAEAFGFDSLNLPFDTDTGEKYLVQFAAGAPGVISWWASALIFFAWTMVFFAAGWAANQRRDIT